MVHSSVPTFLSRTYLYSFMTGTRRRRLSPLLGCFSLTYFLPFCLAQSPVFGLGLNDQTVTNVRNNMVQAAAASWERGTAAEALLELEWPGLSVFRTTDFPPPGVLNATLNASDVLQIAYDTLAVKPADSMALVSTDTAVGDPASLGIPVLLANWTRTDLTDTTYSYAAGQQLSYLLNFAPRAWNGAISHRTDQVQLWSDFIYMAPPFIAYFGITQGGDAEIPLLQTAYDQCRLYRDLLFDADVSLWRHVALGSWQDNRHWGTGNGWAAAGMLRVVETLNRSSNAAQFVQQSVDLTNWINEILTGVWATQQPGGNLLNALNDNTSFADSSSTALLASVTYRMAALTNDTTHIAAANNALTFVSNNINSNGWLQNTVDPYTFTTPTNASAGGVSPEGQSFVVLMHAAWRDYVQFVINSDTPATLSATPPTSTDSTTPTDSATPIPSTTPTDSATPIPSTTPTDSATPPPSTAPSAT